MSCWGTVGRQQQELQQLANSPRLPLRCSAQQRCPPALVEGPAVRCCPHLCGLGGGAGRSQRPVQGPCACTSWLSGRVGGSLICTKSLPAVQLCRALTQSMMQLSILLIIAVHLFNRPALLTMIRAVTLLGLQFPVPG